jgi:DNA adenine methylase
MIQPFKSTKETSLNVKPFLKWAGGKGQLLEQIGNFLPPEFGNGSIARYIEPFVGSGAVFFDIARSYNISELIIIDINQELILAYKTIQENVENLIVFLSEIQNKYLSLDDENRKKYYYHAREDYNITRKQIDFENYSQEWIARTAQMIFLNRTCFNGLFRVNSKGDFNVPMGKYKNPLICNPENLRAVSTILQKTQIYCGDFTKCERWVNSQTFVYFDPPYRPISKTSSFTSYSQYNFNDLEQLRLRDFFYLLHSKGAKLMLSNSDPKNEDPNDNFFEDTYSRYRIERIKASRNINSNAQKRGQINEIIILNY